MVITISLFLYPIHPQCFAFTSVCLASAFIALISCFCTQTVSKGQTLLYNLCPTNTSLIIACNDQLFPTIPKMIYSKGSRCKPIMMNLILTFSKGHSGLFVLREACFTKLLLTSLIWREEHLSWQLRSDVVITNFWLMRSGQICSLLMCTSASHTVCSFQNQLSVDVHKWNLSEASRCKCYEPKWYLKEQNVKNTA